MCQPLGDGWRATAKPCPPCTRFDIGVLTCVRVDYDCVPPPPPSSPQTDPPSSTGPPTDPPSGTDPPAETDPPSPEEPTVSPLGCITFSEPWSPWWVHAGVFGFAPNDVTVESNPELCVKDKCGYFAGWSNAKIEVPYFTNNFYNYKEFTISFWYRRLGVGTQENQGLINMGVCADGGPVHVISTPDSSQATVTTQNEDITLSHQVKCILLST